MLAKWNERNTIQKHDKTLIQYNFKTRHTDI